MLLQQFGVPDARKLDLRAPTNGNHATKRIFQPFRLPRTSKHRRLVNRLCLCRNDLPTSMKRPNVVASTLPRSFLRGGLEVPRSA